MKEINDILQAYKEANRKGINAALATVVHVEGSSYRRPGARMLVTDDGKLTGAISGGCLEGDALRKAMLAISQQQNKLVTYDTTDEDDAKLGVQLGCNGIVHILFEPIRDDKGINPIYLLQHLIDNRKNAVLVTLFSLQHKLQPGTSLLYNDLASEGNLPTEFQEAIINDAKNVFQNKVSAVKEYHQESSALTAFIEFIPPPVSVIIAGGGNDVQPLVELLSILGWRITVVDGRHTHATTHRFAKADRVLVAKPLEIMKQIEIDAQTFFVLMTHNYNYDLELLKELLPRDIPYIGILGPKKKMDRMLGALKEDGFTIDDRRLAKIYSPVGLDIGAETPEEIALSIAAEIKAVLSYRQGTSLREKEVSIHSRPQPTSISL